MLSYLGQQTAIVCFGSRTLFNIDPALSPVGSVKSPVSVPERLNVSTTVIVLSAPDELSELPASRAARPTVSHPDGQYRPGE
jgi:hypothetical protein